jgi:hypothetical protein
VTPAGWATAIAEEGRQYAFYLSHSRAQMPAPDWYNGYFVAEKGAHRDSLTFVVPAGSYETRWINPADGGVVSVGRENHPGGRLTLHAPEYAVDLALGMRRV